MSIHFKQITVIGVGLIGGSFARACREKKIVEKIVGYGRGETNLKKGVELGVIDVYSLNLKQAVEGSDFIFLSTPVEAILSTAREMGRFLKPGVVVTDAGSVKGEICRKIEEILPRNVSFVGSHPIAGTEKGGVEASVNALFEGAKCIITPGSYTDPGALEKVKSLWTEIGSRVIEMEAKEHDLVMGGVSHLPHVVAYALVNLISKLNDEKRDMLLFSAGGFRDITRIASSSPRLWSEICIMNKEQLIRLIGEFKSGIEEIERLISNESGDNLEEFFSISKEFRDRIK